MSSRDSHEHDSHERDLLRAVLDSADDAIFVKDTEHRFLLNNLVHQRLLGAKSQAELLGKTNADVWGEERAAPHHSDDRRVLDYGESVLGREEAIRLPSGEERWISTTKVPLRGSDGSVEGLVAISRDITERTLAEERLRTVVENAPIILFALDAGGIFTLFKGRGVAGLGQEPDEVVGESIFELYRDEPRVVEVARRGLAGEEFAETVEARGRMFDVRYSPLRSESGELAGTIGVAVDVTERAALEAKLSRRDFYDPLTNLPNRALLLRRLANALGDPENLEDSAKLAKPAASTDPAAGHASVGRAGAGRTVAILSIDLDDFGILSGSLVDPSGHPGGAADVLLRGVGERISSCTRPEDLVARTGDDEFTVLLGGDGDSPERAGRGPVKGSRAALTAARGVAERSLEALSKPFALPDSERETFLRASVGIALGRVGEKEPATLLAEAEAAVSRAKRESKGSLALYEQGTTELIRKRVEMEGELARAAPRPGEEFFLLYQPYVSLESRRIVGAEALLRWEHPDRGLLMPEEFIPLAEETGTIIGLGTWVLKEAARQAARLREVSEVSKARGGRGGRDLEFVVGVNVSARQLTEPGFSDVLLQALSKAELQAEGLALEITESALAGGGEEESRATLALREAKSAGVSLAIDDFGTGHSSLSRLGHLPVDFLKTDRSFVVGLGEEPAAEAIVRATVGLASSLDVRVVAEGVETEGQLRMLREVGCELGQGYLFHCPMSADELAGLLITEATDSESNEDSEDE